MDVRDGDPTFALSDFVSQVGTNRATSSMRRPSGNSTYRFTSINPFIVPRLSRIYFDPAGRREGKRIRLADMGKLLLTRKLLPSKCGSLPCVSAGEGDIPVIPKAWND